MMPLRTAVRVGAWLLAALTCSPMAAAQQGEEWIQLFDGRSLDGWTPKITGHPLGENYADTFRVEDGRLVVSYDGYRSFDDRFGHLFYRTPFSYYRLRVEYRFVGDQAPDAPGWALRNSGVMIHAQPPETMTLSQRFPVSIEAQFLGGLGDGRARPTANVCTPGTHIVHDGRLHPEHCLNSASATFDGDGWVTVELEVLGAAQIRHRVNGEPVLGYALPQIGGPGTETLQPRAGELLEGGHLALQSESHPIEFRRVELLDLEGCMDPASSSYRPYFVKSRPEECAYPD